MKKTKLILLALIFMINGCTREVYLAPVPCKEECKPCFIDASEKCPETELMTEHQVYQIEDIQKDKVDYTYISENKIRRCKNVCRQHIITK